MILQAVADGLLTGAIVALGAIGLTLTMGILRFANFAHAELVTFGAYMALAFVGVFGTLGDAFAPFSFGMPLVAATAVASLLTILLALAIDRLVFRRLREGAGHLTLVFASFGVALLVRNLVLAGFGGQSEYYSDELQIAMRLAPGLRVMPDQVFVLGLTLVVVVAVHLFLQKSRLGMAMRATAESPALARINGVDVGSVVRWTWILGATLAAVSGVLYGLTVQLRPELGFNLMLPLFAAAILGGAGSVLGAVVGGLTVGLAENLSVLVIPTGYKPAIPFLILLAVLYLRPTGLFGGTTGGHR